jgi:predicted AAA+ superfamily ATPase
LRATQWNALLVLDEAQKILHWSAMIKSLWDEDSTQTLRSPSRILSLAHTNSPLEVFLRMPIEKLITF